MRYTMGTFDQSDILKERGPVMINVAHKFVKKHLWIAAVCAWAIFVPQNAYALSASAQNIQGEVLVHRTGTAEETWQAITQNTELASGDSIKTRKGTCALVYGDQATFQLDENTTLKVQETPTAQDLNLTIGKIRGKVNHQSATQPFEIVTPAAVATVRGTEVDFGFNDQGQLTVDLHNGKIQVVNDEAQMKLDLDGKKSITIQYDKESNLIRIKNDCGSEGPVTFNVLGAEYAENPCEQKEVSLSTAEKTVTEALTDDKPDNPENPDESPAPDPQPNPDTGREPMSDTGQNS